VHLVNLGLAGQCHLDQWVARTMRDLPAAALSLKVGVNVETADSLRLRVEAFGPPNGDQRSLLSEPATIRRARLREAVRQTRAAAGPDAALRILAVDPDSRVPERRLALAPWEP